MNLSRIAGGEKTAEEQPICAYCGLSLGEAIDDTVEGQQVGYCPVCGTPHHAACWNENQGCSTFGCSNSPSVGRGSHSTLRDVYTIGQQQLVSYSPPSQARRQPRFVEIVKSLWPFRARDDKEAISLASSEQVLGKPVGTNKELEQRSDSEEPEIVIEYPSIAINPALDSHSVSDEKVQDTANKIRNGTDTKE